MVHTPPSPRMQFLARSKRTRLFNRHSAIVYSDTVYCLPCIVNRCHDHASIMHDINSLSAQLSPPTFFRAISLVSSRHHTSSSWILAVTSLYLTISIVHLYIIHLRSYSHTTSRGPSSVLRTTCFSLPLESDDQ